MDRLPIPVPDPEIKIHEYIHSLWVKKGLAASTLKMYEGDLLSLKTALGEQNVHLLKANTKNIIDYVTRVKLCGAKPTSVARYLVSIRGFYKFLVDCRAIETSPVIPIESMRSKRILHLPRLLSWEQLVAFYNLEWPPGPIGKRNLLMLKMLSQTKLRNSELVKLRVDQMNLATGEGPVIHRKGSYFKILLTETLCEEIREYVTYHRPELLPIGREDLQYLFPSPRGSTLTRQAIWHIVDRYCTKVGILIPIRVNDLRQSYKRYANQ